MLKTKGFLPLLMIGAVVTLGGCAGDGLLGGSTTTAALPEKPKVNPACVTLASQIDALRKEGVADRVEAAAKGKGDTVSVKRASLSKIADLNKANAEFQSKCGTVAPSSAAMTAPTTVASVPTVPPAAVAATAKAVSSAPPVAAVKAKAAAALVPTAPTGPTAIVVPQSAVVAKEVMVPAKTE